MRTKISEIDKMIKKVQKPLKLSSYKIKCSLKEGMDSCEYGEIMCDLHKKKADINLNPKRLNDDLEDTIIHELLHLFLFKYLGVAENVFESQRRFKSLKKYREGEEKAIKILATLLKKSFFSVRNRGG